jgi:hypothetical protein
MAKKAKKPKSVKVVEYRYFPATPHCGVLGGIVAPNLDVAETWQTAELYSRHPGFQLVRVRMEYERPPIKRTAE